MEFPFSATTFVLGVIVFGVLVNIVLSLTPKARAQREHRREMAALRSRVKANARRRGGGGSAYADGSAGSYDSGSSYGGGSGCDSGGGDSGGGGGGGDC